MLLTPALLTQPRQRAKRNLDWLGLVRQAKSPYPFFVNETLQDVFKWIGFIVIFGIAVWLQRKLFGRGKGK